MSVSAADRAYLDGLVSGVRQKEQARSTGERVCLWLVFALLAVLGILWVIHGLQDAAWTKVALDHPVPTHGHAEQVGGLS